MWIGNFRQKVKDLKQELHAVALACKDSRTPWYAKVLAGCVIAYALSPIDLIPDPIPVLGYLDDLLLIPLGIAAVRKLIPEEVLCECRARARERSSDPTKRNWKAAGVIVAIWVALGILTVPWLVRFLGWS